MNDSLYLQSGPYIPRSDAGFRDWAENFSKLISADPLRYGLEEADAQTVAGAAEDFIRLYALVQSPSTRTPGLVTQKDAVRASTEATFRDVARRIRGNGAVDNQDRLELGLRVPDPTRTPIARPNTHPLLKIVEAFNGTHTLRYADASTPNAVRKPHGAIGLQLAMAIGDAHTNDVRTARLIGTYSRQPIRVYHDQASAGKVATYFGRWITKRGLEGPWSLPVWMMVATGGRMQVGAAEADTDADPPRDQSLRQTVRPGDGVRIAA